MQNIPYYPDPYSDFSQEDDVYDQNISPLPNQPQQLEQEQKPYNPYYNGIETAIAEARNSLRQTRSQEDRALRSSITAYGNHIGMQPREKGFKNNFFTALKSLPTAVTQYDTQEAMDEQKNNELAQYMIAQQEKQRAEAIQQQQFYDKLKAQAKENDNIASREQQKLDELQRHHSATESTAQSLADFKTRKNVEMSELDSIAPMIRTDSAFDAVGKQTKAAAEFYSEALDVKEKYDDLKQTMQQQGIDTTNPLVFKQAIRNASGIISSYSKDPVQREIAKKYADVNASNKRLMQTAEKALKAGALTNFTVKYGDQNDLFPNFKENADVYETKLDHLLHDANSGYESSQLSMSLGRHVNKQNYAQIKQLLESRQAPEEMPQQPSPAQVEQNQNTPITKMGSARIMDPDSRIIKIIPIEKVPQAIKDGWVLPND